jgi:hypothetical protein
VNAVVLKSVMPLGRANGLDDFVSLAMEEGLERCLLEIVKSHENKTGQWLDAIESDVLTSLKVLVRPGSRCRARCFVCSERSAANGDGL